MRSLAVSYRPTSSPRPIMGLHFPLLMNQQLFDFCHQKKKQDTQLLFTLRSPPHFAPHDNAMSDQILPPFLKVDPPLVPAPSRARLQALYASTSAQRTANPTGYAANSQWWAGVLEETLRTGWLNGEGGDKLVLKVDNGMLGRLEDDKGSRPKGLGGVVVSPACVPACVPLCASLMYALLGNACNNHSTNVASSSSFHGF